MAAELEVLIVGRREVAPGHVEIILENHALSQAVPGQFCHVLTPGMLRRPISFSRIDPAQGRVGILLQVVGSGTSWIYDRPVGSTLNVLGPLGTGFPAPTRERPWCLVGGGVGIPPLYACVERWLSPGRETQVILGARTGNLLVMIPDFSERAINLSVTTDDGSQGSPGTVIGPLKEWIETHPNGQVYACGPTPMLKAVAETIDPGVPAYLALEQRMGCGIGACLACVVPARGPHGPSYQRVCTEGPVFRAEELIFS